jgi:glycine/D-amino acid oxidase-like deaminating enzyme
VLGAGIQGTCAALALAEAGYQVELLDRAAEPLLGASRCGEGKIHLGLVYANEPSRATAALMIDGCLAFGRLIDRWVPGLDWAALRSEPFHYAVLADTMVPPEALIAHYEWVDGQLQDRFSAGESYLGRRPAAVVEAVDALEEVAVPTLATFRTAEVAVEMKAFRGPLIAALSLAGVAFVPHRDVVCVGRTAHGFVIESVDPDERTDRRQADLVVNCLWDGRLAVDATMGIVPERPWVFRLKQSVEGRLPPDVDRPRSITFVLGPYGDIVERTGGDLYVSWYPAALAGWSTDLAPPDEWRPRMDRTQPPEQTAVQAAGILDAFAETVPALREMRVDAVYAGVIAAWGKTDITDHRSELHSRHAIGVSAHDGYYSIDTGKLTTAPLFAALLLGHL